MLSQFFSTTVLTLIFLCSPLITEGPLFSMNFPSMEEIFGANPYASAKIENNDAFWNQEPTPTQLVQPAQTAMPTQPAQTAMLQTPYSPAFSATTGQRIQPPPPGTSNSFNEPDLPPTVIRINKKDADGIRDQQNQHHLAPNHLWLQPDLSLQPGATSQYYLLTLQTNEQSLFLVLKCLLNSIVSPSVIRDILAAFPPSIIMKAGLVQYWVELAIGYHYRHEIVPLLKSFFQSCDLSFTKQLFDKVLLNNNAYFLEWFFEINKPTVEELKPLLLKIIKSRTKDTFCMECILKYMSQYLDSSTCLQAINKDTIEEGMTLLQTAQNKEKAAQAKCLKYFLQL